MLMCFSILNFSSTSCNGVPYQNAGNAVIKSNIKELKCTVISKAEHATQYLKDVLEWDISLDYR